MDGSRVAGRITSGIWPSIPSITREKVVADDEGKWSDLSEYGETDPNQIHLGLERAVYVDHDQLLSRLPESLRADDDRGHHTNENQRDQGDHRPRAGTVPRQHHDQGNPGQNHQPGGHIDGVVEPHGRGQ